VVLTARPMTGGRQTVDDQWSQLGAPFSLTAPDAFDQRWRLLSMGDDAIKRLDPHALMDLLADTDPGYARALYDTQRLGNPGWELVALALGTDEPDRRGQAVLDAFVAELEVLYGTADVVFNRLLFGAFHRGAVFAELVLDESGRIPIDLATPDPASVRFRREVDPARPTRGPIWRAGQWQRGQFVIFDRPTVVYVPIDPFPGSPYGRPLGAPALFTSLFLMGMMSDLRRVIQQQGWPRLDIVLKSEELGQQMPPEIRVGTPAQKAAWVQSKLDEVVYAYAALLPDDAFVHLDTVEMGRPQGVVDASALGAVEPIIGLLQRQQVQAVKTMPLLQGLTEGTSEANANRQWEVHAAGVKALQHLVETPLGRLLSLALQAAGIPARAVLRFSELRAAEMMRDEQSRALRDVNSAYERDQGWIDQDAASQIAVGHAAVGEPRLAPQTPPTGSPTATANPEPGANREVRLQPLGAAAALPSITREPVLGPDAVEAARAAWASLIDPPNDDLLDATLAAPETNGHRHAPVPAAAV
jgi:hypothetical protein